MNDKDLGLQDAHTREQSNETRAVFYDCEICGAYHKWDSDGDCRCDSQRFFRVPSNAEVRSWDERIKADQ